MGKLARRNKRRRNPDDQDRDLTSLAVDVGVGTAGYAVTRLLARAVFSRVPARFARHAHVLASGLGALGVFFGTRYVRQASAYHQAATVGAGIAFAQSLLQTYGPPKLGFITADVSAEYAADGRAASPSPGPAQAQIDLTEFIAQPLLPGEAPTPAAPAATDEVSESALDLADEFELRVVP